MKKGENKKRKKRKLLSSVWDGKMGREMKKERERESESERARERERRRGREEGGKRAELN